MMPSSAELARIRADMEDATLPDVCNILSLSQTSDGQGGLTDTWTAAYTNIPCRLDLFTSRGVGLIGAEIVVGAALKAYTTWILSVPHGTVLTSGDRVSVSGNTYNIIEVDSGRSWGGNVRATVEKL
jgi:hypothetical protein